MASIRRARYSALLGCALAAAVVSTAVRASEYQVLHSFNGTDGSYPNGDLQLDAAGNLYGTTAEGGAFGHGSIFKVDSNGAFSVFYSFTGGADGGSPGAGLAIDKATGDLYGTTYSTIFRITANGDLSVLHGLHLRRTGNDSLSTLTRDNKGNLYGTTFQGGPRSGGGGVVFKLTQDNKFKILSTLGHDCGGQPIGRLLLRGADLYGAATIGGSGSSGVVFKVSHKACTGVHAFNDGVGPIGGLARDDAGNLYGAKIGGGSGYIYALSPGGAFSEFYAFTGGADGGIPVGDMLLTKAGMLYGVASRGGEGDNGTVFALDLDGTFTLLHSFTGAPADGAEPTGGLIQGKHGAFYGTTIKGGANDQGVIFSVTNK